MDGASGGRERVPDRLVERDEEIRRLRRMLDELRSHGTSAVTAVVGEFGAGRSALLERIVALAEDADLPVAFARCSPQESDLRYAVVRQLLSAMDVPMPLLESAVRGSARLLECELVAQLCRPVLRQARETGLVVVIDDLQFADPESSRWVQGLARRAFDAPVLMVLSVCVGMFGHARCHDAWQDVRNALSLTELEIIRPRPLTRSGVAAVLDAAGPADAGFIDAAVGATGGNPAVLRAVVDHFDHQDLATTAANVAALRAQAAEAVRAQAARMVETLPAELRGLLQAVAVADGKLPVEAVCSLSVAPTTSASRALRCLRELGLVTDEERPRLADRRTADPVLGSFSARDRQAIYARAAEVGYRAAIADDEIAALLVESRRIDAPWAVDVLRSAALADSPTYDRERVRFLRRALLEPLSEHERAKVLVALGSVELSDQPGESDVHLAQVADAPGDERTLLPLRLRAVDLLQARGAAVLAQDLVSRIVERLGAARQRNSAAPAVYWLAAHERPLHDCPTMRAPAVLALPESPDEPAQAGIKAWLLATEGRDRARARKLARAGLARSADADQPLMPRIMGAITLMCTDDFDEALACLDSVLRHGRRLRASAIVGRALLERACVNLWAGNLRDTEWDLSRLADEFPGHCWHPTLAIKIRALTGVLHLYRDEIDQAETMLAEPVSLAAWDCVGAPHLLLARGRLRLDTGDSPGAVRDLEECGRRLLSRNVVNPVLVPWRGSAVVARQTRGDHDGAVRLAEEQLRRAEEWGSASAMGCALLASVVVTEAPELKERLLSDAVRILEDAPMRLVHADAVAELARARARTSGPRSAVPLLHRVARFARANAVGSLDRRLAEIVRGLGLDSDDANDLAEPLAEADEHLIELAGRGLSNREIAAELGVSRRTVERRLAAVYRKLGVSGRAAMRSDADHVNGGTENLAT